MSKFFHLRSPSCDGDAILMVLVGVVNNRQRCPLAQFEHSFPPEGRKFKRQASYVERKRRPGATVATPSKLTDQRVDTNMNYM